jgi:tRNA(fMet)-specific endonuclease VapC
MDSLVLDTDVCSFLQKPGTLAELYRTDLIGHRLCVSFQTVAELYQWAEFHNWQEARRRKLEEWLRNYVVLPFDNETCWHWARVRAARRHLTISPQDAWVAAAALRHNLPLVTHNGNDFVDIPGLIVVSHGP